MTDVKPMDAWLRFAPDDPEQSEAEANVYPRHGFDVQWYLTAVGLVRHRWFATYEEARAWLVAEGFEDYSSGDSQGTCRHCGRAIRHEGGRWIDPEATGDDVVWRETCDSHDAFTAEHEPEELR